MDPFTVWSLVIGLLLVLMALGGTVLARLPLSTGMLYLAVGAALSPLWLDLAAPVPLEHVQLLERLAEVAVLISLFTAGLKMSPALVDRRWRLPLRLATLSMVITVGGVAAVGTLLLDLPLGAAVLLGAILAPTDPVLASDVQMEAPGDRDRLRFALTAEGGLNDGTAFPFVMLGLGLLGLHELGDFGWRWLAVDVLWAVGAGLAVGALLGDAIGRLVLWLRRRHAEAVGLDDFLALGLVALSYGVALGLHAYGFLAVFAAGVALRRVERRATQAASGGRHTPDEAVARALEEAARRGGLDEVATHVEHAPSVMAGAMLRFNEQIERIAEVTLVLAIGALLWAVEWRHAEWWLVPLLFLVIRPLSVWAGLARAPLDGTQRRLVGWFGIRGIGSLYYLMYAVNHGLDPALAERLVALTLMVVVASIVLHGVSVTPLMKLYERSRGK